MPDAAEKSPPAVAVPATVAQLTVDVPVVSPVRMTVSVAVTVGPPLLPSVTEASPIASTGNDDGASLSVIVGDATDGDPSVYVSPGREA